MRRIIPVLFVFFLMNQSLAAMAAGPDQAAASKASQVGGMSSGGGNQAADAGATEKQMQQIVVTATRVPTSVRDLPVHVQIISRKQIEQSHADNIGDLLTQALPGNFQSYPGALTSVNIRGFSTDTSGTNLAGGVLLLVDGHRAGTGNLAEIPLGNIERIEIVYGPASVLYGSAAMGGVINLITRKGKGPAKARGSVQYGSWGTRKASGGVSGGWLHNKIGYAFTGRHVQSRDYKDGDGDTIHNSAYHDAAFAGSLDVRLTPHQSLFATGQYYDAWDIGTPGPTYDPTPHDYKDLLRHYWSLAYEGSSPDRAINWNLSCYDVLNRSRYHDPEMTYGYSASTTDTTTRGMRSQVSFPTFSLGTFMLGGDWDHIAVDYSSNPAGAGVYSPSTRYDNYAGFGQEKMEWGRFSLLLGLRYDYFNEAIRPTQGLSVDSHSDSFDHLSWRGGATYFLLDWLSIRAAVGTGFRAPTADELSGSYNLGGWMKTVGNPNLKPESSTTYEVGLDAERFGVRGGMDFFYTDYSDRITYGFPACANGDCTYSTYKNLKGATISGLEGHLSYRKPFYFGTRTITLKPYMNFTYYTQRNIRDAAYAREVGTTTVPYVSKANVTGGIQLSLNGKATIDLHGFYVGPQKVQDWSQYPVPAIDKGGFAVFGSRLTIHPEKHLDLYLAVNNLANRNYAFVDGYPMPGREVSIGMEGKF
jgi:vitamin B12 transporter